MQVADGLEYRRLYFMEGNNGNVIKDPPTSGYQNAFVIQGEKRSTIFCPYTFGSWSVPNNCWELTPGRNRKGRIVQERDPGWRPGFTKDLLERNWRQYQGFGWQRDYDTAVVVFRRMGWEVPETVVAGGGEPKRKGGKEVAEGLTKPVKRDGKRGRFLAWFLETGGSRSVREAMAEFGMSRSNALSYLFMLRKDHGIGYELVGDIAHVTLPEGCTNPFDTPEKEEEWDFLE